MSNRPNVIAFVNNRLVKVEVYEGTLRYAARAEYCGVTFLHEAVVYRENDVYYVLKLSRLGDETNGDMWGAEAFMTEKAARNHAFHHVAHAQGRRVGA